MGIYDRDYFRNESPGILETLLPSGMVCRWLIGINIGVFILQLITRNVVRFPPGFGIDQLSTDGWVTEWLILDTRLVAQGEIWRLLSYAFLHPTGTWTHIVFNMLFLWWFGSDVEQLYGRKEFLTIYLVSAVLGGLAFQAWAIVNGPGRCLGASGAVTTMLVLCACHFPRRVIYVFLLLPMPIWLFAVFNVVKDAYTLLSQQRTTTAVVVHLAGAAFAIWYYKWQHSLSDMFRGFFWWKSSRSRPRLKIFDPQQQKEEPVAVSASSPGAPIVMDEHLEAKLDAVLEKIARAGKDSLTEQEQKILQQASEMYKRRRS
jgi:membrane associated rhomboid family serine protease